MSTLARQSSATTRPAELGSVTITDGVRVSARPSYLRDRSEPGADRHTWSYRVRIVNETDTHVKLLRRRWLIIDGDGERKEVAGDGVVGQQPVLSPGESYEYSSFCPLDCAWGTMEGWYTFARLTDAADAPADTFDARIGRFYLISPGA
ncbi:MAG TPA: Co2+/Mg2+ efflux protein ApaG [Phycisphaerales bacterium]|nr:Co2+/Mg2+ efflux protein ApaG [Phycisphaerales bacterium]